MKKRKGFTLIELIAVLVIMAVVAIVVAPLILDTIKKAKYSVNMRSIDGYGRAVELAMASYQLENLTYPDSFDELEIEYNGNKVECDTSRINYDHTIYLSGCRVNGKYVKSDKNRDGYYHYGMLKMTNIEYVDTYGNNLKSALKKYYDSHREYPKDYTVLKVEELDKDVSCDVSINYDGTICLENCKVNNETVVDGDSTYVYGDAYATTKLLNKVNSVEVTNYTDGDTHEMYAFNHEATDQTPALTDYRYIGNNPYNYVKFAGDESWRIIGVFDTEDANGNWDRRIKLIKNDSIGRRAWNSSNNNKWIGSALQVYLLEEYVLNNDITKLVDITKYYLGEYSVFNNGENFYKAERSSTLKDELNKSWSGKIGLMYPSDYLYTYSLGIEDNCYSSSNLCNSTVALSGWLYYAEYFQHWTMTSAYSNNSNIIRIVASGNIGDGGAINLGEINPVLYLKPNVKIKSGAGTIDNPYEFEL